MRFALDWRGATAIARRAVGGMSLGGIGAPLRARVGRRKAMVRGRGRRRRGGVGLGLDAGAEDAERGDVGEEDGAHGVSRREGGVLGDEVVNDGAQHCHEQDAETAQEGADRVRVWGGGGRHGGPGLLRLRRGGIGGL